jgi:hypothetical protein
MTHMDPNISGISAGSTAHGFRFAPVALPAGWMMPRENSKPPRWLYSLRGMDGQIRLDALVVTKRMLKGRQ